MTIGVDVIGLRYALLALLIAETLSTKVVEEPTCMAETIL